MQQDASTNLRNTLMSANFTRLVEDLVKFDLAESVSRAGEWPYLKISVVSLIIIQNLNLNRTQNDIRSKQSGFPWNDDGKPTNDQQHWDDGQVAATKLRRQPENHAIRYHERNGHRYHFGREVAIQHLQHGIFIFIQKIVE